MRLEEHQRALYETGVFSNGVSGAGHGNLWGHRIGREKGAFVHK